MPAKTLPAKPLHSENKGEFSSRLFPACRSGSRGLIPREPRKDHTCGLPATVADGCGLSLPQACKYGGKFRSLVCFHRGVSMKRLLLTVGAAAMMFAGAASAADLPA